jgi:uncharacterized membrane protein YraQ (UPF0718 family)
MNTNMQKVIHNGEDRNMSDQIKKGLEKNKKTNILEFIKKNKLLSAVILIYGILLIAAPDKGLLSLKNSMYYVKEMLMVMPAIFILTLIIDAWVPKELILKSLGEKSGIKGGILSLAFGSLSAGPLYAAFPMCKMLLNKGASIANIVIILSSWAVIKVPMLANEAKFLGVKFMSMRWVLTVISIFVMAYILSKIVKKEDMPIAQAASSKQEEIVSGEIVAIAVKKQYCIGCGMCEDLAPKNFEINRKKAIVKNEKINDGDQMTKIKGIIDKCPVKAIYLK